MFIDAFIFARKIAKCCGLMAIDIGYALRGRQEPDSEMHYRHSATHYSFELNNFGTCHAYQENYLCMKHYFCQFACKRPVK